MESTMKNWMFDQAKQVLLCKFCIIRLKMGAIEKSKALSIQYSYPSSPMLMTKNKYPKWDLCKKSKELHCLTMFMTLQFENLFISSCFSSLKDLSLDGLAIKAECLLNSFPSKLCMQKWLERGQLDYHRQDSLIIRESWLKPFRILSKWNTVCVVGHGNVVG